MCGNENLRNVWLPVNIMKNQASGVHKGILALQGERMWSGIFAF